MSDVALGFVETRGNTGNVIAIDAMMKTAKVEFVKKVQIGGAYVTAVIRGDVAAVNSSVQAGAAEADKVGDLVCANVIPDAHEEVFDQIGVEK